MKKQVIIPENEWYNSIYRTLEWELSVNITRWEHDYVKKQYVIDYIDKH